MAVSITPGACTHFRQASGRSDERREDADYQSTGPAYAYTVKMTCGGCSGAIDRVLKKNIEAREFLWLFGKDGLEIGDQLDGDMRWWLHPPSGTGLLQAWGLNSGTCPSSSAAAEHTLRLLHYSPYSRNH